MQARLAPRRTAASASAMIGAPVDREADLHNFIADYCRSQGWIALRGSMAHRAMRTLGEPDFTILADHGRVFCIECKTRTGKLSTPQLGLAILAEKLGHKIHCVRSMKEFLEVTK